MTELSDYEKGRIKKIITGLNGSTNGHIIWRLKTFLGVDITEEEIKSNNGSFEKFVQTKRLELFNILSI